jgi:1-acyl-sn-glycerol-3-phosphate acyltransferase
MKGGQALFYRFGADLVLPRWFQDLPIRTTGLEHVPRKGPCVLIANHRSVYDPLVMVEAIRRPINFIAADFLFKIPAVGWALRNAGVTPIRIDGGQKSRHSLDIAVEILRQKQPVGIFPEGATQFATPDPNGVGEFRTGFARIAYAARCPVVPMAVVPQRERTLAKFPGWLTRQFTGSSRFTEGAVLLAYEGSVELVIGAPLDFRAHYRKPETGDLLHAMARQAEAEVRRLYGVGKRKLGSRKGRGR